MNAPASGYQKLKIEIFTQISAGALLDLKEFTELLKRFDKYFNVDDQYIGEIFTIQNPKNNKVQKESIAKIIDTFYNTTKDDFNKYDSYNDLQYIYKAVFESVNSKGAYQIHVERLKEIVRETTTLQETPEHLIEQIIKMENNSGYVSKEQFKKDLAKIEESLMYGDGEQNPMKKKADPQKDLRKHDSYILTDPNATNVSIVQEEFTLHDEEDNVERLSIQFEIYLKELFEKAGNNKPIKTTADKLSLLTPAFTNLLQLIKKRHKFFDGKIDKILNEKKNLEAKIIDLNGEIKFKNEMLTKREQELFRSNSGGPDDKANFAGVFGGLLNKSVNYEFEIQKYSSQKKEDDETALQLNRKILEEKDLSDHLRKEVRSLTDKCDTLMHKNDFYHERLEKLNSIVGCDQNGDFDQEGQFRSNHNDVINTYKRKVEELENALTSEKMFTTTLKDEVSDKQKVIEMYEDKYGPVEHIKFSEGEYTSRNNFLGGLDDLENLLGLEQNLYENSEKHKSFDVNTLFDKEWGKSTIQENTTSFVLPKKIKEAKDSESQTVQNLIVENSTQTQIVIQIDSYTECVIDLKNEESQTLPKNAQDFETQTMIKELEEQSMQTDLKVFLEINTDTSDLIKVVDEMLDPIVEVKTCQTETKGLISFQDNSVMTDPLPKPEPLKIIEKSEPEVKVEYVYIEKEPEIKIEYIYVDPPVKNTSETCTQIQVSSENCSSQTKIENSEKETQIYTMRSTIPTQTINAIYKDKEIQTEEDARLKDLTTKTQITIKELNNKMFNINQELSIAQKKQAHSESICGNLRNDLEKKNKEIKELHEKFEITNRQKQERVKLESLAQKKIQQLDAEIENLKKINEALREKEKNSSNQKNPVNVSSNAESIIDIYLSRCNLSSDEKNQLVSLLSWPLQNIQQQTSLAQLLMKSALTEKDQEHLKQEIHQPILKKLLNKCTLNQEETDTLINTLTLDVLDKESQVTLRKLVQRSAQTKGEVLDLKCLIIDPIIANLLKDSELNFREQQQLKIQLQTPHWNAAQFSLINTLFHKSNLVIEQKVKLKNYLQQPLVNKILENSGITDIENEQLKVLFTEENALAAQHKNMLAQLLQKSALSKDDIYTVKGQITALLPSPIQTFINNSLKSLNLLPNEQEQIKSLLLKQQQTLQEQGLLQQLYHKSKMNNTDIQGLKTLYEKEKKQQDLIKKSALTNSEKANLVYLLQYATQSPEQQNTQENLKAKTGLTRDEKELLTQLIRGPLVANLLVKLNLSKDEQQSLKYLIEKPNLTKQEYLQMNTLLDKSKLSQPEKIQLVNMLHKLLIDNIVQKTEIVPNEQEELEKLLKQVKLTEEQDSNLNKLLDKSKLKEEEKVQLKSLFKEPMLKSLLKKSVQSEIEQRELRNLIEIQTTLNPQQQYNLRCLLEKGKLSDEENNNLKLLIKSQAKHTTEIPEATQGDTQSRMKAILSKYNLTLLEQDKLVSILLKAEELSLQEKNILKELMQKANISDNDKNKLTALIREHNEMRNKKMQQTAPQNEYTRKITEILQKSGLSVLEQDKLVELLQKEKLTPSQSEELNTLFKKSNLTDQEKDLLKNYLRKTLYKVNTFDPINCKDEFEHKQLQEENERLLKVNENYKQELIYNKNQLKSQTEKYQSENENFNKSYEEKLTELRLQNSQLESNQKKKQSTNKFENQLSNIQMDYALEKSNMEKQINMLAKEKLELQTEMTRLSMDQAFLKSDIEKHGSNEQKSITDKNFFDNLSKSDSPRGVEDSLKDVKFSIKIPEPSPTRVEVEPFNKDEIQLKIENFILKDANKPTNKRFVRKASIVDKEKAISQIKKAQEQSVSQNVEVVIQAVKPKTRVFNESILQKHDKLELNKSPMISRILQTYGENPKTVEIYSESISRINSLGQRKNKLLMITDNNLYIITSNKQNIYEEKRVIKLTSIGTIKVHATNKGIFQVCVKHDKDDVLESFDRNQLCLQIQRKSEECCNHKINIKKVSHIELRTRDNIIANLFSESAIVKNEMNEVFRHSDKVGHLKLLVSGLLGNNIKDYTMVLSNIGIIYMSTNDLKCKGFIPIIGTNIKKMPKDTNHSIIVMCPDGKNSTTMLFGSEFEQEDWYEAMKSTAEETHNKFLSRSIIE